MKGALNLPAHQRRDTYRRKLSRLHEASVEQLLCICTRLRTSQREAIGVTCHALFRALPAQPLDQAIQLLQRAELHREFACLFHLAGALGFLLHPHFDLRHEQVGQFFLDTADIA